MMGAATIRRAQARPAGESASAQTGTPVVQDLGTRGHFRATFIAASCRQLLVTCRSKALLTDSHIDILDVPDQVAGALYEGRSTILVREATSYAQLRRREGTLLPSRMPLGTRMTDPANVSRFGRTGSSLARGTADRRRGAARWPWRASRVACESFGDCRVPRWM